MPTIESRRWRSCLDPNKTFGREEGAVTLICAQRGNHAMLIIEAVAEATQEVFVKRAHLEGLYTMASQEEEAPQAEVRDRVVGRYCYYGYGSLGRVTIDDKTGKEIRFSKKTETWIRSKEKVMKLLSAVEKENQDSLTNPRAFNIFGRKSVFADRVEYFKINNSDYTRIYIEDPALLMSIFSKAREKRAAFYNSVHCTTNGESARGFSKRFLLSFSAISLTYDFYLHHRMRRLDDDLEKLKQKAEEKTGLVFSDLYDDIVLRRAVTPANLRPDNCFTWAREKLTLIDVTLPKRKVIERVISPTRLYLKS